MPNLQKLFNEAMFAFNNGNFRDAEKLFRQAVEDDPAYAKARVNLGLIMAAQGRLNEAEKEITAAIQIQPDDEQARKALAEVQLQLRKK